MTYAAVGSSFGQNGAGTTISLTTSTVGDFVLAEVSNHGTAMPVSLSSSHVTWSPLGTGFATVVNSGRMLQCFIGVVTSATTATVTIGFGAGTTGVVIIVGQEFSSTTGTPVLDVQGNLDQASGSTWASLTPAGNGELYFGFAANSGAASAGTTTGYVYNANADTQSDGMAYNVSCSGGSATAPVWADTGEQFGVMVLVAPPQAGAPGLEIPPAGGKAFAPLAKKFGPVPAFRAALATPPPQAAVTAFTGTASLVVTAGLTEADTTDGGGSLAVTASLTAAGTVATSSGASLVITDSLTETDTTLDTASLAVTVTLTAAGTASGGAVSSGASLTVTAGLTAAGTTDGAGSLTVTAGLTAAGKVGTASAVALTVTAGLTAAGQIATSTGAALTVTVATTAAGSIPVLLANAVSHSLVTGQTAGNLAAGRVHGAAVTEAAAVIPAVTGQVRSSSSVTQPASSVPAVSGG